VLKADVEPLVTEQLLLDVETLTFVCYAVKALRAVQPA
jgi:hypothetical protein